MDPVGYPLISKIPTMKTRTTFLLHTPVMPLLLFACLFVACSGDGNTDDVAASSASSTAVTTDASKDAMTLNDADASNTATTTPRERYNSAGVMDPAGNYNADGTLLPGVILTPAQERADAMASMNGIRATLMAELTEVRSHLKDGTLDKEHAKADQDRAADLAQGLERVDRALAAMGGATDATWNDIRTAQMKEAGEVRTWWNAHMAARDATAQH